MGKVILIYANCCDSKAKGDFAFAGNIAKDLIGELQEQKITGIDVILVSTLDGVGTFESMYGAAVQGRIDVEGVSLGLCSMERFDSVINTTLAFIEAKRCKFSSSEIVKRVLAPETKFLFVYNANQELYSEQEMPLILRHLEIQQPNLYKYFDRSDIFVQYAGIGANRIGLPTITQSSDLPQLSLSQKAMLPQGQYGFMYLSAKSTNAYNLIAQYIKLTHFPKYCLVGNFVMEKKQIADAYALDTTLSGAKSLPPIEYYQSLPNAVMRRALVNSSGTLVVCTGITSALEAMKDNKLTLYQDMDANETFVASYLIAVHDIISNDSALFGTLPNMIIELSKLLFAPKPLTPKQMSRTQDLLTLSAVNERLVQTNQKIIHRANGTIASKLLAFIGSPRRTTDHAQLVTVCASLRKPDELGSPVHDQALRRAAFWGRLFELKVLIKSMSKSDLNKQDLSQKRTALHWAVLSKNHDCARLLLAAGSLTDIQDKEGCTPLHVAVRQGDRLMIEPLISAGASLGIPDNKKQTPLECAKDYTLLSHIVGCHQQVNSKNLVT